MNKLIDKANIGFDSLGINQTYVKNALRFLETWLTNEEHKDYVPQIEHLILSEHWDYLLDSFYQVIPFGTGGRRGEVGVGPNRINPWTIQASAQGHSQYLIKKHGNDAKSRGVVLAYDVREFLGNKYLNDDLQNPVQHLTSKDLANAAAETYAANNIKVHLFSGIRTTPELSFAIRHLKAVAGDMFSASHNPPDHNGKKVYDEFGGQLIPPHDEKLTREVTEKVKEIQKMPFKTAVREGLVKDVASEIDKKYLQAATSVSLSKERDLKIVYTPLHGCGTTSVTHALKSLGFDTLQDPKTSNASGKFENIVFNIPNPEVIQSFNTTLQFAKEKNADIVLSSDPDADRIGVMVHHKNDWVFLNGQEIACLLVQYVIQKKKKDLTQNSVVIKTTVTTNLIKNICEKNGVKLVGDLLIGFKYIADIMNALEKDDAINEFLVGCEESHGYIAGNYSRDKDAVTPAIWLAELSAELKKEGKTLIDYLDQIYTEYGYFQNYLTEIRLLGASGQEKINKIQDSLRAKPPKSFGEFAVARVEDCLERKPIVSETDKFAKNVLIFHFKPTRGAESMKVTIRPSGTEPKIKLYFEIGAPPPSSASLADVKKETEKLLRDLEKSVMLTCYKIIGVDFPERGFLLFWQLPLNDKLTYFKIEPEIEKLKNISNKDAREKELSDLLSFLGSDPIEKIDGAFKAKYKVSVLEYLDLQ